MKEINLIIASVTGIAAGSAIAWIIMKSRLKTAIEKTTTLFGLQIAVAEEKLQAQKNNYTLLEKNYVESKEQLFLKQEKTNDLNIEKATLAQQVLQIPLLETGLNSAKNELKDLEATITNQKTAIAELKILNTEQQKQAEEKILLLTEAKALLKTEFQNIANKIFEEKSSKFTDQNKTNLNEILNPLREQIGDFKGKVEDVYDKESRDRISLLEEIKNLKNMNLQISKEAINLTNALKGDNKIQGNWGEVILERVLEQSGLQKGREYETQLSLQDKKGNRYQPDVIVRLPEEKDIVIDAKVSLKDYERYFSAETEPEKEYAFKAHIGSIRTHIKTLSQKRYEDLEGIRSLDFVLLFIPIEAAFLTAIEQDQRMFGDAFEKNIIVVCPSTLLVTLRTIQNIWRYEDQNRNAVEIAKKAGGLYDKFVGFIASLEDIGKQIVKAKDSYEIAHGQLVSGNGNLVKRAETLKKLGVSTKKKLPGKLVEKAENVAVDKIA